MFKLETLTKRVLLLALSLPAAACATLPAGSGPMALGAAAAPPPGFVAFCQRNPEECDLQAQAAAVPTPALAPSKAVAVAAIASAEDGGSPAGAAQAAAGVGQGLVADLIGARYDWSGVFGRRATTLAQETQPVRQAIPADAKTWSLLKRVNERVNRAIARQDDMATYGQPEVWNLPIAAGVSGGDCEDYALEKRHALIKAGVPQAALSIAVATTPRGESHAVLLVNTDQGEYVLDNLTPWVLPWAQTGYVWRERQVAGSAAAWAFAATGAEPTRIASLR